MPLRLVFSIPITFLLFVIAETLCRCGGRRAARLVSLTLVLHLKHFQPR